LKRGALGDVVGDRTGGGRDAAGVVESGVVGGERGRDDIEAGGTSANPA